MRIVQERVDKENYLELCISPREFQYLKEYMILSKACDLEGNVTNIGIKLELDEEETDDEYSFRDC